MKKAKTKKVTFKYEVGTILSCQGASVMVIRTFPHNNSPAYEVISPNTKDEGWLVGEEWLETSSKSGSKKQFLPALKRLGIKI